MWICLIGAPTCKQAIARDLAAKEKYKHEQISFPRFIERHPDSANLNLLDQYFRQNVDCQSRMMNENIVTISSFWSQHLVYAKSLLETSRIDQKAFEISEYFYNRLAKQLEPPSIFLYTAADHITVRDRMNLKREEEGEEWVDAVRRNYDELAKLIRVPVVEIDAGRTYSKIWDSVEFDVAQMKTTRSADQTLWRRTMFRSGAT